MIECLIFDCDGTLVDSELLCNRALSIHLEIVGVRESAAELMRRYRGDKLANIFKDLERIHGISCGQQFERDYRALTADLFKQELQAFPTVRETLEKIRLTKSVASNGPRAKIEQALSLTGLESYFGSNIFSAYEIESWKPSPNLFLHAAHSMGFKPEQCMVIDDSEAGIEAGLAANMNTVYFDPESKKYLDKKVSSISCMSQLIDLLD